MQPLEIIIGFLLVIAAAVLVITAFNVDNIVPLGAAVLALGGGVYLAYYGIHGENAKFHHKHVVIENAIRAQGFTVRDDDVYATGGTNFVDGTEVDLRTGPCVWPFIARKIANSWKIGVPANDGTFVALTPRAVAALKAVCSH